jgi:hypothetical protein
VVAPGVWAAGKAQSENTRCGVRRTCAPALISRRRDTGCAVGSFLHNMAFDYSDTSEESPKVLLKFEQISEPDIAGTLD